MIAPLRITITYVTSIVLLFFIGSITLSAQIHPRLTLNQDLQVIKAKEINDEKRINKTIDFPQTVYFENAKYDEVEYLKIKYRDESYKHEHYLEWVSKDENNDISHYYTYIGENDQERNAMITFHHQPVTLGGISYDCRIRIDNYFGTHHYLLFLRTLPDEQYVTLENQQIEKEQNEVRKKSEAENQEDALWKETAQSIIDVLQFTDEEFQATKTDKIVPEESRKTIQYKNHFFAKGIPDLTAFDEEKIYYRLRPGHSEFIRYEIHNLTEQTNVYNKEDTRASLRKLVASISELIGDEYTLVTGSGDDVRSESVYKSDGYNAIWKHNSEMGKRELKKKFIRISTSDYFRRMNIYVYNNFPEK